MTNDRRPRLDSIINGGSSDFNSLWAETVTAGEFEPLPAGKYRALVADGRLAESKRNQTPAYKVTFEVLEPSALAARKIWHDIWLTPKSLGLAKRDLAKLGITDPAQLSQPLPAGMVADVKLALRTEDDGQQYNRVLAFSITAKGTPSALDPDDDDGVAHTDAEGDASDSDGFDWQEGVQR